MQFQFQTSSAFDVSDEQAPKCIGPGGKLYPMRMRTDTVDISFLVGDGVPPKIKIRFVGDAKKPNQGVMLDMPAIGVGYVDFDHYNKTG